jgi:hypothetical protein
LPLLEATMTGLIGRITTRQDVRRVRSPDDEFERDEEFQLAHQCETNSEHDSNGEKNGVGDHV